MPRLGIRPRASHPASAAAMRNQPGEWLLVITYHSSQVADSMARSIRTGDQRTGGVYQPPGAYEARTEPVDDGTAVYGRYTGPPTP
ncbi:hypothetical protein [Streptomyces sp. NPDC047097]|uniref:hypothetical protein n=1 Tax=Streptomyces sp. NPDC047097 TaxID=3155260 RepID=UPI0034007C24